MKYNVNVKVRVKLTEHGKNIYGESYPPVDTDGVLELPLWNIMNIFGKCFWMGAFEIPFIDNEIEILDNKNPAK